MTSAEIRKSFLDFFSTKGHEIVPSAPIVVKNDPTLMFTNAGMNQFKDYFLGNKKPSFQRVADTQKCLRVSGKHNDLEEVGVDTYHHTMFEMLGNWSFGDPARPSGGYFKKEAIAWSWELLTEVYRIDKNRLYVTIFQGDDKEGLPKDDEAFIEWKKWLPEERILMGSKKDNFWEMGDTGPCGPCTEIHYDSRPDANNNGHALVNNDETGKVVEIWNNVFIQFNRLKDGRLEPLPAKHVDTGMGLERLVRVLQNKNSNYDTDIFTGTIAETEKITKKKYEGSDSKKDIAFRVVADHIRAIAFTIADGQLPSNTGAGYVIRRILRRAVRYYYSYLDYKQPLLDKLIPLVSGQFENVFPELIKQKDFVAKVIHEEEEAFLKTVEKGLAMLSEATSDISGEAAFKLYDTYGFPIDLTKLVAAEKGLKVDENGFGAEMQQQKSRSRAATSIDAGDWIVLDDYALNEFVGYEVLEIETRVIKYRNIKIKGKDSCQVVLEATPFYAESGGQVGDTGELIINNEKIKVTDTKKENNLIVHYTDRLPVDVSGPVTAKVDAARRKNIVLHHSATHLLHAALRKILGLHVMQKGSLVNEQHLRFDFSHFTKLSDEEIAKVEKLVNEKIRENIPVIVREIPKEEALKMGAMALFGEKYGDTVRVVIMDSTYSIELCGGTHVGATGELGLFKITHETAVAAGVRRIEAMSGRKAEEYIDEQLSLLQSVRDSLKNPKDVLKTLANLTDENLALKKHIENLEARQLVIIRNELLQHTIQVNQLNFIAGIVEVSNPDLLKKLCFELKNHISNAVVALCANIDGKPHVAILITDNLVAAGKLDAAKIIKEQVSPLIKGGGGGQKSFATAGGADAGNLNQVIEKIKSLL
ncbi:MAG: alanine--tRNA ligase [Bacteroidetes bacterium]|nr:alanine--tRNA ligase [Bacteroidota bacterium]MBS1632365.1 alanine--tRNA ligase [Bacteroidota bacterium]